MISRQVMTVSATISAKVAGDVGRFYASFIPVNAKEIMFLLVRLYQGCFCILIWN